MKSHYFQFENGKKKHYRTVFVEDFRECDVIVVREVVNLLFVKKNKNI